MPSEVIRTRSVIDPAAGLVTKLKYPATFPPVLFSFAPITLHKPEAEALPTVTGIRNCNSALVLAAAVVTVLTKASLRASGISVIANHQAAITSPSSPRVYFGKTGNG